MNEFMRIAVENSLIAYKYGDVPVGAVIVKGDEVIASTYNKKNIDNVAVFHAEILAIIEACKKLGSWYLNDCDIYVTLKPCDMCLNAIAESRIKKIYYLLDSNYVTNLNTNYKNISLCSLEDVYEYKEILQRFFRNLR